MKVALLLTTLIVSATAATYKPVSAPPCKEYEVYEECGSACHPTCETVGEEPTVCTLQCVSGCYCQEGLFRTASGGCVPEAKCNTNSCPPS